MAIVLGLDFSPHSLTAAEAAAALARGLGDELVLVHADAFLAELPETGRVAWLEPMRERLRATAESLRQAGASVSEKILTGPPDETLTEYAAKTGTRLIVVSSLGRTPREKWLLGSVAERTAQTATLPVLVVRDAGPFLARARGEQPLRVFFSADFLPTTDAALRWVAELRRSARATWSSRTPTGPRRNADVSASTVPQVSSTSTPRSSGSCGAMSRRRWHAARRGRGSLPRACGLRRSGVPSGRDGRHRAGEFGRGRDAPASGAQPILVWLGLAGPCCAWRP